MRHVLVLLSLLLAQPAYSAGMAAVSSDAGFCGNAADNSAMCYEWELTADASVRFVAYGFEDGIDYSFFRLLPDGSYEELLRVYPVICDASRDNALFWGYPWDIRDIEVPRSGTGVLATFGHDLLDDGEIISPDWQARIPVVLFRGTTTQPQMTVGPLELEPSTLDSLRVASRANSSFKPTPLRGTPGVRPH